MSKEYSIAIALLVGSVLKMFGYELDSVIIEGAIFGVGALLIAIFRKQKGDINMLGFKK